MTQTQDRYIVRFPDGMRDEIAAAAKANGRSMNAEIIARLSGEVETLRDKFAGQAVQAAVSGHLAHYGHENHWPLKDIASYAYEVADAMLAARKGGVK
ncbi:Arc family DNA-binding protein [Sinorhizobium meliloti]|uniref:Arc family DNA-binding protein n=1 Tax=Rhizobium meliloti TaxID=382 RepID=UPI000B4A2705|nr:Arc family DNA-binding protein [Sinorhizobium meliloti]ASP50924.1 Arc family DNA-binding protein [Sinorhizobium meliloti]